MFNNHPYRNGRQRPLPEVAETPRPDCSPISEDPGSQLSDESAFKVMLKRNLRHEAPPADLLGNIRARIEKIRAEK